MLFYTELNLHCFKSYSNVRLIIKTQKERDIKQLHSSRGGKQAIDNYHFTSSGSGSIIVQVLPHIIVATHNPAVQWRGEQTANHFFLEKSTDSRQVSSQFGNSAFSLLRDHLSCMH